MLRNRGKYAKKSRAIALILGTLVITAVFISAVAAKYISNDKKTAEIHASGFHFSSDYLESDGQSVNVSDWSTWGIVFHLYNYEKENIAQISDSEIQYRITVPSGWQIDTVKRDDGAAVAVNQGVYTIPKSDERAAHTVALKYVGTGNPGSAAITVEAVSPYEKTLQAEFKTPSKGEPTFTLKEDGGAVCMTIQSNNYAGPIRVKWPGSVVSPDNVNSDVDMSAWLNTNAESGEVFQSEANHIYTLFFMKNSDAEITDGFFAEGGD